MTQLLMVVPSRDRPQNLARLWETMGKTCRADTRLIVGLDAARPGNQEYPQGPSYIVKDGLRQVGAWLNELAVVRAPYCNAIGHFGDDNVPLTDGWDEQILSALEREPFAFANDLYPREPGSLPCHIFMRSKVISALGYMAPPTFRHMVDLAWLEWGKACGIAYLHDVIIEHRHWSNGKTVMDDTYLAVNQCLEPDHAAYAAYCAGQLASDVAKIKAVL